MFLVFFIILLLLTSSSYAQNFPNILLIIVDDLRPSLGCYSTHHAGQRQFVTPNIDKIAEKGVIFTNAFAQQALCGPSRTSFLTGRRPDSLRVYDNSHFYWRISAGNFTSLPQYFKSFGYETVSAGKVFHPGKLSGHSDDWPFSWSRKPFHPKSQRYKNAQVCPSTDGALKKNVVCPVDVGQQPKKTLPDIETAQFVVEYLGNKSATTRTRDSPFFLAVGFHKPHIPLKYPREFKKFYPLDTVDIAKNPFISRDLPKVAWNPYVDLRHRDDVKRLNVSFPYGPLPKFFQRLIRQSYFSSVTYVDFLTGRILSALEHNGFSNNTVILLTSDHGWSLGEHAEWSKYSNFGVALRVPLIFYAPSLSISKRNKIPVESCKSSNLFHRKHAKISNFRGVDEFVELVDVFPSLVEIAGLPSLLVCPENGTQPNSCVEGDSFIPYLTTGSSCSNQFLVKGKRAIFAQYPRPSLLPQLNSDQPDFKDIRVMGYTMRTKFYQYTEWVKFNPKHTSQPANWKKLYARELYDLRLDKSENVNVISEKRYRTVISKLSRKLRMGWREARPNFVNQCT